MSSPGNRNYQGYNPIALMDNASAATVSDESASTGLASTHSSQQLMPSNNRSSENVAKPVNTSHRPTSNKNWLTISVLCFVNLINYMDRFTLAGVLTDIQKDFGIGDDKAGLLQTAFVISYMVCAPLFGYLGDRYSRRWIMAIGVFLWSTTTLLGSFMTNFGWFITFRALVGVGEASYSTIAPTIISDLFVDDMRSKMLAMFYFAIPVGSGFGYIVGSETARLAQSWRWALRVTPFLGILAVILLFIIKDPVRGESEGNENLECTTYKEDIKDLVHNKSFMLSTGGFTCVAFVAGALSWWGPKFIFLGLRMQPGSEDLTQNDVAFKFGALTMVAGIIGVPLGACLSQVLQKRIPTADPLLCAFGLFLSMPLLAGAMIIVSKNTLATYAFIFFGQIALNLNWAIVADILLYVVVPTRRSTAEAFQILISHALGDAGSPYLVGVLSEIIKKHLRTSVHTANDYVMDKLESLSLTLDNSTTTEVSVLSNLLPNSAIETDTNIVQFEALQYALFSTSFVEVLGGIFFLLTAAFILEDKAKAIDSVRDMLSRQVREPIDIDELS